ncbi:uncharacterized protein LOC131680245 [Topomyia yanbarensis]|uniref:uncharacterized protein LOC131680245 n=1 Tax=Topomyia yanbarensis TaxID=2498891 RepID=UPI00273C53FA|nr:uncharacterized protein LOC131680245 [Topomyia yanbarensis]
MDQQLKGTLVSRRDTMITALSRAEAFIADFNIERDQIQVALRLQYLDKMWATLEAVQGQLEDIETTNEGKRLLADVRANFEPRLFKTKASLIAKLPSQNGNVSVPPVAHSSTSLTGIKLPTITLPEFDGDYNQWLAFHDTFLALIHSNPEVPDVQKFHYLRAAVKGEAAQSIESIAISSANYKLAWEALVSRYDNEYLLKKRHLQALFSIPCMQVENPAELHRLVDEFERHVKILHQLGEPTDQWSTILEHLLCIRLHDDCIKVWEDHASTLTDPNYRCLVEFLHRRVRVLESICANHHGSSSGSCMQGQPEQIPCQFNSSSYATTSNFHDSCLACNQPHPLIRCEVFHRLSLPERQQFVYSKRLCHNCLRADHIVRNCSSSYNCRKCNRRHHTLLHPNSSDGLASTDSSVHLTIQPTTSPSPSAETTVGTNKQATMLQSGNLPHVEVSASMRGQAENVFLMTAVVTIIDSHGQHHSARALLDSASQPNLISARLASVLQLKRNSTYVTIHGAGNLAKPVRQSVTTEIRSRRGHFSCVADFLVMDVVTSSLPKQNVSTAGWKIPSDVVLADPSFNQSQPIDLILGAKHFCSFFPSAARMQLNENLPNLVDSVFGWVVSGAVNSTHADGNSLSQPAHQISERASPELNSFQNN